MSKSLLRDLPEMISRNVVSEETAGRIRAFYTERQQSAPNRLLVVFGILGALLIGMGIVLIIAHNWDDLGKVTKLIVALLPLLAGQLVCAYTLLVKEASITWREASATFLFFSIAASISIVSQVYSTGGTMGEFLFAWMILSLPVVYVMRSSMASLLYILGITWYACQTGYFGHADQTGLAYWPFLIAVLPHYLFLSKTPGNFFHFHTWFISLSLVLSLGTIYVQDGELVLIAYVSLLCAMLLVGQIHPFSNQRLITNAFLIVGSLGIISILLQLSFRFTWVELLRNGIDITSYSNELAGATLATLLAGYLLYYNIRRRPVIEINLKSYAFILVILLFAIGYKAPAFSQITVNLCLLAFSVSTIMSGARKGSFSMLNYGLLILTALITCRFFDTNLSFVIRGLLFVLVGVGFFALNYYMIKRRRPV